MQNNHLCTNFKRIISFKYDFVCSNSANVRNRIFEFLLYEFSFKYHVSTFNFFLNINHNPMREIILSFNFLPFCFLLIINDRS